MEVSVLGPVRVIERGDEIHLGPSVRRLLVALVVSRDVVVDVDRLADLIWAGEPPPSASTTLRSHVTRLRQAIGSGGVIFRQTGYTLGLSEETIDAVRFESELGHARDALRVADLGTAREQIECALERWQGRPFAGYDDDWIGPSRSHLEERHTEALELQIEIMLAERRIEEAIAAAMALRLELPLRERPRSLLMRALAMSGRLAEAVREFSDYRTYLGEETGLDPSSGLATLEEQIVRGELPHAITIGSARGYELGRRLGRGAFSVVHHAVQPGIGREVAIKIIRPELADRPEFVRRFEREAQLVASVEHPFVVPLYDFWREPGAAYLVMRWMRGGNLADLLRTHGPLSVEQLTRLLETVGVALHTAHRAGLVHGDVRPANLLLDDDGSTYVADFGIATPADAGGRRALHYAAPEALRGEPADRTVDILALGVTVFELLTGRLPYDDSDGRTELVRQILAEPLPPVKATRTDLPSAVDDVLARAASRVRGDRYDDVVEFVEDLTAALVDRPPTTRPVSVENPYLGLVAFTESDADRFHGREQLVADLVETLERSKFVTLVGPSGSGKSSVVRAGLLPALHDGAILGSPSWYVTVMQPGADPIGAFEAAVLRIAVSAPSSLRDHLAEPGGLLRSLRRVLPDDDAVVLLVIDQFEEVFTRVEDDEMRRRFLAELAVAVQAPHSPLRIVATLRADHYDAPMSDAALAELVTDGTVTVRPMRADELERAIVLPARSVGVEVEQALVAELVGRTIERPASLPLLQYSLTEVFRRRVAGVMMLDTHRAIGGITGALAARADRAVTDDATDEVAARRIFERLVAVGPSASDDARRRVPLAAFGHDERTVWLIDHLLRARLLVADRDDHSREPTLEVAHEALLREWPRLRAWIDDDRDDLRLHRQISNGTADWWSADEDVGLLARGARLELAADLLERRPELMNETERSWVERSTAAEEAARVAAEERSKSQQRQYRRTRRLLVSVAALLVVTMALASVSLVLRSRARASERTADVERLIAVAGRESTEQQARGILLALEAHRQRPSAATAGAIQGALFAEPRLRSIRETPLDGTAVDSLSADGRVGLAFGESTAVFVSTTDGTALGDVVEVDQTIIFAEVSGNGDVAALTEVGGSVTFVDRSGRTLSSFDFAAVYELAIDPSGTRAAIIASQTDDGDATVVDVFSVDVTTGQVTGVDDLADDVFPSLVAFSPDARSVIAVVPPTDEEPTQLVVMDARTAEVVARRSGAAAWPADVAWSANGGVVVGYVDSTAAVYDIEPSGPTSDVRLLLGHTDGITSVAANEAGDIATAARDGSVRVWPSGSTTSLPPITWSGFAEAVAIDSDRTTTVAALNRPVARFSDSADTVVVDRHEAAGAVDLLKSRRYFTESDPSGEVHQVRSLETGAYMAELRLERPWDDRVARLFPSGGEGQWILAISGGYERVAVWSADGTDHHEFDLDEIHTALGVEQGLQGPISLRPSRDGRRMWALIDDPARPGALAAWLSIPDLEVVSGPLRVPDLAASFELADGSVAIGGERAGPIVIAPVGLTGDLTTIEGTAGFAVHDVDENTGLMYLGGERGDVAMFDPGSGELTTFARTGDAVSDLAVSPTGDRIAAATDLGVQLIDAASGDYIGGPMTPDRSGFGSAPPSLAWNADGSGVWFSIGGPPVLLAATAEGWIERACDIVRRDLTREEWTTFVDADTDPVSACDQTGLEG